MRPSRFLALDCGTAHLAVGLFAVDGKGQLRLEQLATAALPPDSADESAWLRGLTRALTEMLEQEQFRVTACVLTVPGHLALTKLVKTPAVGREQRPRVVQFEASQNIPYPLDEVAWNYLEIGDDGVDMEFMLSAVKLDAMEALCNAVEAAGLQIVRCETTSLTLWRAYHWCMAEVDSAAMIVDVGARSTQVVLVGGGATQVRTLALGGNTITQAIAAQLQVEFATAETLKLSSLPGGVGSSVDAITQAAVAAAAADFSDRLQRELKRSQLAYQRLPGAIPPRRIILTGQGSLLPNLAHLLAAKLALPVEGFAVWSRLGLSKRAKLAGAAGADEQLANLVGLALPLAQPDMPVLDLLPESRRESLRQTRGRKWWLAAAALLVLLPLAPMAFYMQEAARLEQLAKTMEADAGPMRRIESINAANLDRRIQLEKDLQGLLDVAAHRTSWMAFLTDMQGRLNQVGDIWLDSLQVERDGAAGDGEATNELRLNITGRLLDPQVPPGSASQEALGRAKEFFRSLAESPFIAKVERDRFVGSKPGILRFEITLVMNPEKPL
jgi:type IV pilus assembly protein PilM